MNSSINNIITFDTVAQAYEFHIEYSTKIIEKIYRIEHLDYNDLYIDDAIYSDTIWNKQYNTYFQYRNLTDLASDLKIHGMYFPLFGHYNENNQFIVDEGTHRAKALQGFSGKCMCISKFDNTKFYSDSPAPLNHMYMYEYIGNNTFRTILVNNLNLPAIVYIENNIKISEEIFNTDPRIRASYIVNNSAGVNRLPSTSLIVRGKKYYSLKSSDIQEVYNKFADNVKLFDTQWIDIHDIKFKEVRWSDRSHLAAFDPFLTMDKKDFQADLIKNGMMAPFIVYIEDGEKYIAEGHHRYHALKDLDCKVECIVYDLEKIYEDEPCNIIERGMDIYIPKNIFPYNMYPYIPGSLGFIIVEETDLWYKIKVHNKTQLMQAYKLMPAVLKHMVNYLHYMHGESIKYERRFILNGYTA